MNWEHKRIVKTVARNMVKSGLPIRIAMVRDRIPSVWHGNGYTFDPSKETESFDTFVTYFEGMNRSHIRGDYAKFYDAT